VKARKKQRKNECQKNPSYHDEMSKNSDIKANASEETENQWTSTNHCMSYEWYNNSSSSSKSEQKIFLSAEQKREWKGRTRAFFGNKHAWHIHQIKGESVRVCVHVRWHGFEKYHRMSYEISFWANAFFFFALKASHFSFFLLILHATTTIADMRAREKERERMRASKKAKFH
jgi:hypothetical protein